ncbi:MAG TPA: hypothetical protein PK736_06380, partial [Bacteroidia bacterium]|nr:hypothetical protein [Bacteroidia bacterium]
NNCHWPIFINAIANEAKQSLHRPKAFVIANEVKQSLQRPEAFVIANAVKQSLQQPHHSSLQTK